MRPRRGHKCHVVNFFGGSDIVFVKMPIDGGTQISMGGLENSAAAIAAEFHRNIDQTVPSWVEKAHGGYVC